MLTDAEVRRRRIAGAVAAVIGALLIVLAVLALTGKLGAVNPSKGASDAAKSAGATSSDASGEASGSASASDSNSDSANKKAPLTVLNAGSKAGVAKKAQAAFEAEGWTVTKVGNYSGSAPKQSTVYYPADDEAAHVAAQSLVKQFPALVADKAPSDLPYDGVVVVLTDDWSAGN